MKIEFIGAARTVTGSKHIIRTRRACVLLDCGLFQGRRREANERNRALGVNPSEIDVAILSHAHIDHAGALPILVKHGYSGPIFATPATRDLSAAMLEDAALVQAADARFINKSIEREHADMDPVRPLFDEADVTRVLTQMVALPYHRRQVVAPGVTLTFLDAGHVLGSSIVVLDLDGDGGSRRLVFTGDLGRKNMPILRDPEIPSSGASMLVMESTYGDRRHKPIEEMTDELASVLRRTYARGGKVVIPAFALERAQELIFALSRLRREGRIPPMPVFVDSPLTVRVTDIFKLHPDCYDAEARRMIHGELSPFDFEGLKYVSDTEESKAIDASPEPAVIISASGMCESGRVVHHLKSTIEDAKNTVVIVGFQAQHTLGRRIVERRSRVRIFGVERALNAEVVVLNGFSAHADQAELVAFAEAIRRGGALGAVALVHGEPPAQDALRRLLEERGFPRVIVPSPGDQAVI